jgi:aspartyl-tRNA(Asn)/glutamyl-tRNA(Gln) amidotransferase subunit A
MDNLEICYMPGLEMAEAIKAKKLSPVEIIDAILSRIERLNPKVNAYCTVVSESARKQAKEAEAKLMRSKKLGRLHGVPVSIKDLIFTKGIRTTGGSKIYENFIPEQDAIVVERLKSAGAIILGKTNTPEFGWTAVTVNQLFGATRNPWNLEFHAGGSSGGAAASVAAGMGPLAIGSDGGGSIRIPSSFCGVFGFKPSIGRVPQGPGFPGGWEGLSHIGPITMTVRDAALLMEIIAGRDDRDHLSLVERRLCYLPRLGGDLKGLRVAWSENLGYAVVDQQVLKLTRAAVNKFRALGCQVEADSPKAKSPEAPFSLVVGSYLVTQLKEQLALWRERIDTGLVRFVERSKDISAVDFITAREKLSGYWMEIQPFFEQYDLLLTPTVAVPSFEVTMPGVREIAGVKVAPIGWMPFTYPFNITGQPAASIPCGWTDKGLPVGLQIIGRRFDDATVLRAAAAFEAALPWAAKRPPLD